MKKLLFLILFSHVSLSAGIPLTQDYHGPTEQLIKKESWKSIEKRLLKMEIPKKLYPFFNSIAENEHWGHIGYHGASHDYRVYQDIIRMTVQEILGIPVRENFHFLRIPGDPGLDLNSIEEFSDYWNGKFDNKNATRAKQLISLNYGIYSNYEKAGSCSISLFVRDTSKHDIDYIKKLKPFYESLGIDQKALKHLFDIAHRWLNKDCGILLRLSENSHLNSELQEAYNFADIQCYPCKRGGYRWGSNSISSEYEKIMSNDYVKNKSKVSPQLRMLMNNQYTLNPFSYLIVERWDLYDTDTINQYEEEMNNYIKQLKSDPIKVQSVQEKFLKLWL